MNEFKDFIKSDIQYYMVNDYLSSQYSEPAQIIAYEDAYQITEAISSGNFLGKDGQIMSRKAKSDKMLNMLKANLFNKKKENFEGKTTHKKSSCCTDKCVLF